MKTNKERLLDLCSVADSEHMYICDCQDEVIAKQLELETTKILQELEKEGDQKLIIRRVRQARKEIVQDLSYKNKENNVTCTNEHEVILNTLKRFARSDYETVDPAYFLIFKSLLTQVLASYRIQRHNRTRAITYITRDKNGESHENINPAINEQRKTDDLIISAAEKLHKMKHGTKVTQDINLAQKPIPIKELFGKIKVKSITSGDGDDE